MAAMMKMMPKALAMGGTDRDMAVSILRRLRDIESGQIGIKTVVLVVEILRRLHCQLGQNGLNRGKTSQKSPLPAKISWFSG